MGRAPRREGGTKVFRLLRGSQLQRAKREGHPPAPIPQKGVSPKSAPRGAGDLEMSPKWCASSPPLAPGGMAWAPWAPGRRGDTALSGKQQAAAPYLAPAPGCGDSSILAAQGGGVGCVCLGVWALPELQRPLAALRTEPLAGLPAPDPAGGQCWLPGRGGGRVGAGRLERGLRAGGCVAPRASSGASTRRGCAPGSRAVHGLAPAAAVTAADPAPGRSLETRRRRRQRREGGEAQLVQMQSAQSLEGNRLQTWAGAEGGEARDWQSRK